MSPLAHRIATVLREAGEDGLTLAEIETMVGTRWALRVIRSMNGNGYAIGEQNDHYYLVAEPGVESGHGGPRDEAIYAGSPSPSGTASSMVALSTDLTLFELPPESAIDPLSEAA